VNDLEKGLQMPEKQFKKYSFITLPKTWNSEKKVIKTETELNKNMGELPATVIPKFMTVQLTFDH